MRLFALGRSYRGQTDVIVEVAGTRRNLSHEARVLAARAQQDQVTDCRETVALAVRRDMDEHGRLDVCEQGRV